MKIKNKIFTLLSVFTLVGLSHSLTLQDLNAALSAPASYDLNYQYDAVYEETFVLGTSSIGDRNVIYTRTTDSSYYNYTTTISNDIPSLDIVPEGLSITMIFNRSNTNWFSITGGYLPSDTKIGSDNSVGSVINKYYFSFNNQTNKNYKLFIDLSSSSNNLSNDLIIDSIVYVSNSTFDRFFVANTSNLVNLYLPSFTNVEFRARTESTARYFDAWYLKDLGVSDAFDAGYDAGSINANENADLLVTGFTAMVGILVNFVLMIVNLEVLGVSILGIFSIILLFTTIVWVLKLIRG